MSPSRGCVPVFLSRLFTCRCAARFAAVLLLAVQVRGKRADEGNVPRLHRGLRVAARSASDAQAISGAPSNSSEATISRGAASFRGKDANSFADLQNISGKAISVTTRKQGVMPFVDLTGEDTRGVASFVGAGNPSADNNPPSVSNPGSQQSRVFGPEVPITKQFLSALGGGTGALRGGTGDEALDRDLVLRMHYQDKAVLLMLLLVYITTLCIGASMTYRQSLNDSTVTYYADPRYYNTVTEDTDLDRFLDAFAQVPKNAHLQVTGFVPMPEPIPGGVDWNGQHYHVAFTFSLDLSPWVVRLGNTDLQDSAERLEDGVVVDDRERLAYFLANNGNDLACVEMHKEVTWAGWEELATNIKSQIRQRGFTNGVISVRQCEVDPMGVYKNTAWANFMHSRLTKVLCALSLMGWFIYLPYMWLRSSKLDVRSRYKIDLSIDQYWPMDKSILYRDRTTSFEQRSHM